MLADEGKALDESNNADASVKQRLDYALKSVSHATSISLGIADIQGFHRLRGEGHGHN
jgi:hypothetical protein